MTTSTRLHRLAVTLAAAGLLGSAPGIAFAEDEGLAIAQHNCARCHEIAPGAKAELASPPPAPKFVDIANDPKKYPEDKLYSVLNGPHAKMEPHAFTAIERRSLIDYIHGLAKK